MHLYGSLHRQRTFARTAHIAEILASTVGANSEEWSERFPVELPGAGQRGGRQ
jgi:hypothetical protein